MTDRPDSPAPGDVWRYPYLWAREEKRGETEGRKSRPVSVAFLIRRKDGLDYVLMLAHHNKGATTRPTGTGSAGDRKATRRA